MMLVQLVFLHNKASVGSIMVEAICSVLILYRCLSTSLVVCHLTVVFGFISGVASHNLLTLHTISIQSGK